MYLCARVIIGKEHLSKLLSEVYCEGTQGCPALVSLERVSFSGYGQNSRESYCKESGFHCESKYSGFTTRYSRGSPGTHSYSRICL